ncbi:MAG TPA: ATP-binding protein [Caulobacteraceae bacterium]|jgi:hypothetical protein
MAVPDIAFAASAGAIGLALAVTSWAWRFRVRATASIRALQAGLADARADADRAQAAADMFDTALVAIDDGSARLASGRPALSAAMEALGLDAHASVEQTVEALAADEDGAARLTGLIERGEPCRFTAAGPNGAVSVEGSASGAVAWLRLSVGRAASTGAGDGRLTTSLAGALPAPVWIADSLGAPVWANRAWLAAAGAETVEQARASGFDRSSESLLLEARREGARREGFRWMTVDGQRRAWRVVADPLGEDEVLAYALDVTEAEETREMFKRHVEAHDETLNKLADAVVIFGPSKRLTFHNIAFQALFGLDGPWLDERPTHAELLDRLRQKRRLPEVAEYAKWKAQELEFYGSSEAAPDDVWTLPDGRTLRVVRQPHPLGGMLLLFSDITDELKLRAQYNALIQVQQATLDKLNDAVAVFGSDSRLRLHNEAFERFWSLGAEALEQAGDFEGVAALCKRLLPEGPLWGELQGRVADPDPHARVAVSGEARTTDGRICVWQTRPLPDGATLVAFDDVTATRQLEKALSQREAALDEATRLKREFVGNVSYELRTPLTTIVGYGELMQQDATITEATRRRLNAITSAATQLARSIDDVLDMAQIDADEMSLSLGDVRMEDLIQSLVDRARPRIEAKGARLEVSCSAEAGLIRADERRLGQAIDHLLDNAARAAPPDTAVTLKCERINGEVRISVRDEGRGIPFHVQAHVFDRYVGRDRGGPGLGMALVKALTELHGGWVALESEPGLGATFVLHLPVAAAASPAEPELNLG